MNDGYSICFNEWALDKNIKNELNLLLIISSLCAEKGFCYASNEYLGELFNLPGQTISRKLKILENANYISIKYEKRGCEIISREIRLTKMLTDDKQNCEPTINKNVKENNISNNNINIKENIKRKVYFENEELNNLFYDFLDLRVKLKAKNTDRAINLLLKQLEQLDQDTQKEMINNSIMNSWKGLYPIKNKKQVKVPEWFNKEIKEEMSDGTRRICKELEEAFRK